MPLGHVHITVILILLLYCLLPTSIVYFCHCCGILLAFLGHPYELSAHLWFGIVLYTGGQTEHRTNSRQELPGTGATDAGIAGVSVAAVVVVDDEAAEDADVR